MDAPGGGACANLFMVFPPTLMKNELLSESMRRTLRAGFGLKVARGGAFETLRASFPLIHARRVTSWLWGNKWTVAGGVCVNPEGGIRPESRPWRSV